jgi:hypothetical protein
MLNQAILWILTGLAALVFYLAVATKRLTLARDYFFFFIYVQMFIYLHLAPNLWTPMENSDTVWIYVQIEAACLFLFEIPFLALYIYGMQRPARGPKRDTGEFHIRQGLLFLLLALFNVFAITYLAVVLDANVFFFHYGYGQGGNLSILLDLNNFQFYTLRLFQLSANFLLCAFLACFFVAEGRPFRKWILILLVVPFSIHFAYLLVNSRGEAIVTLAMLGGVALYLGKIPLPSTRRITLGIVGALAVAYILQVSSNIRTTYSGSEGLQAGTFNPFSGQSALATDSPNMDLRLRLNSLDLMAQITPSADLHGFAHGEAWVGSLIATFGQFLGRDAVKNIKESYSMSPQTYLLRRYTTSPEVDAVGCWLSDAYGNFGIFSFPFVAVLMAEFWVWITHSLLRPRSAVSILLALFFLTYSLRFEYYFDLIALTWIRGLPVLILVLLLNPLSIRQPRMGFQRATGRIRRSPVRG